MPVREGRVGDVGATEEFELDFELDFEFGLEGFRGGVVDRW